MKKYSGFLILLFLSIAADSQTADSYYVNDHVNFSVQESGGFYHISYTFKDQYDSLNAFSLHFESWSTNTMIKRFGVPVEFYGKQFVTPFEYEKRKKRWKKGFFVLEGNTLKPDRIAVVQNYRMYTYPIARQIVKSLKKRELDSREARIQMAMKFVQDIPYGKPVSYNPQIDNAGFFTPPELLLRMYGDCDSKSVLFACILSYLINSNDIIFITRRNHMLTAVKGKPHGDQCYINYPAKSENTYILAETSGPDRPDWGEADYSKKFFKVEPLLASSE